MKALNLSDSIIRKRAILCAMSVLGVFALLAPGCNETPFSSLSSSKVANSLLPAPMSGRAVDAKILGGELSVYSFKAGGIGVRLAEPVLTSKEDGSYTLSIRAVEQPILVVVTGGHYIEEATGVQVELGDRKLRAVTFHTPGTPLQLFVTPFTNLAAGFAQYKVSNGTPISIAISEANSAITNIVGVDILATDPKNITDETYAGQSMDDGLRYGFMISTISAYTAEQSVVNGYNPHENINYTSIAFHDIAYRDIINDGQLDGIGKALSSNSEVNLGMGITDIDQNTYRTALAREMMKVSSNKNINKTSLTPDDLLFYAQDLAANGSKLFDGIDYIPLDDTDPIIEPNNHYENEYVAGDIDFKVDIEDFTGIKSVKFYLNDEEYLASDMLNPSFSFDSSLFDDGPYDIRTEAVDSIGNVGTQTVRLHFVNTAPVLTVTSAKLVAGIEYPFEARITTAGQDISEIQVNGVKALIEGESVTSNLVLASGVNTVTAVILDEAGSTYEYDFRIDVDDVMPTLSVVIPKEFSGYSVFYKPEDSGPVLRDFNEMTEERDPLFISQSTREMGVSSMIESNIKVERIPYFKVTISDESTVNPIMTDAIDLELVMTYKVGNSVIFSEKSLLQNGTSPGEYIVPLVSEVLGPNWYQQAAGTINIIDLKVRDKVGNEMAYSENFAFSIYYAEPIVGLDFTTEDVFSGDLEIALDGVDLTAMSKVVYTIDGQDYVAADPHNPTEVFNTKVWDDGVHTIVVTLVDEYNNVFQKEMQFTVDNTPPTINISSEMLVGAAKYTLTGDARDGLSQIKFVDVDGNTVDNFDENTGNFDYLLTLNAGANPFTVSAMDEADNGISKPINVLFDDSFPHFDNYTPSETSIIEAYFTSPEGVTSEQVFKSTINEDPLHVSPGRSAVGEMELTTSNLADEMIPFIHFRVFDEDAAISSGAFTNASDLKVTFSYFVDNRVVIENQAIPSISDSLDYLLPISSELLGGDWVSVGKDALQKIEVSVSDTVGNTTTQEYFFKVNYEEMPLDFSLIAREYFRKILTVDLGDLELFSLTDTEITLDGVDQVVNDKTTHPVTKIDTELLADGEYLLATKVTNRLGRVDTEEAEIRVDNTAPIINFSSELMVGLTNYSVQGSTHDAYAGVKSLTINGTPIDTYNTVTGAFEHPAELVPGANPFELVSTDIPGNAEVVTKKVLFDNTPPLQSVYMPTDETTFEAWYVQDDLPVKQAFRAYNNGNPLHIAPGRRAVGGLPISTENLQAEVIPYLHFNVIDIDPVPGSGALTPQTDLVVQYSYFVDGAIQLANINLTPVNENFDYIIPLTSETLGGNWTSHEVDSEQQIQVTATDIVGNMTVKTYNFKVMYAPLTDRLLSIADTWVRGIITVDLGDVIPWSIIETEVDLEGKLAELEGELTNPVATIDTNTVGDGPQTITANLTNRLDETDTFTAVIKVDNKPPTIKITSDLMVGLANYNLQGVTVDEYAGVQTLTIDGTPVSTFNTTTGEFEQPLLLTPGINNFELIATDVPGNNISESPEILFDNLAPLQSIFTPTEVSLFQAYFDDDGSPVRQSFKAVNSGNPLHIAPGRRALGGLQVESELLTGEVIPYIHFNVVDIDPVVGSGAFTESGDIEVNFTYIVNGSPRASNVKLNPINENYDYIIPLASEFLGEDWVEQGENALQVIVINAIDSVGNVSSKTYSFSVKNAPLSDRLKYRNKNWVRGTIDIDLGDVVAWSITDTVVDLDGTLAEVKNITTHPVTTLDTLKVDDGESVITAEFTNRLGERDTFTAIIQVDNKAPTIHITSDLMVGLSNYNLQGLSLDSYAGVQTLTINGSPVSTFNTSTGLFEQPLTLVPGKNNYELVATDKPGNSVTASPIIRYDNLEPTQEVVSPTNNSTFEAWFDSNGTPVRQAFRALNTGNPLHIAPGRRSLGGMIVNGSNLSAEVIPYIYLKVDDYDAVPGHGAFTEKSDLTVSYTYKIGENTQISNSKLNPINGNYDYIIPLASEFLGANWVDQAPSVLQTIEIMATDSVGNSSTEVFSFKVKYAPLEDPFVNVDEWVRGNINLDLGNITAWSITNTEIDLNGSLASVSNKTTRPTATLNTTNLNDGVRTLTAEFTNRLGEKDEFTKQVKIDNTAPSINITSDLYVGIANYSLQGQALDAYAGVETLTINGTSAQTFNTSTGYFAHPATLAPGRNDFELIAQDIPGNAINESAAVRFDNAAPTQTAYMPTVYTVFEAWFDDNGTPEKQLFKAINTGDPLSISAGRSRLGGLAVTTQNLQATVIPYIHFNVVDLDIGDGTFTPQDQLSVYYDYSVNGVLQQSNSVLSAINNNYDYIIPLVGEVLGNNWTSRGQNAVQQITIYAEDSVGNTSSAIYKFKVKDAPMVDRLAALAGDWVSGILNIDLGDVLPWAITETTINIDSSYAAVSNSLTTPTASIDTNAFSDGIHSLTAKFTNRLDEVVTQTTSIKVDNNPPVIVLNGTNLTLSSSAYTLTGSINDAGIGVDAVTLDGSNAKSSWNSTSKVFAKSVSLLEGKNEYSLSSSDLLGNADSRSTEIKYDASNPSFTQSSYGNYSLSYKNGASKSVKSMALDGSQWWVDSTALNLSIDSSQSVTEAKGLPYVRFLVSDPIVNSVGTLPQNLEVTFNYTRGGISVIQNKSLSYTALQASGAEYIIPLTEDALGEGFWSHGTNITHTVTISVKDEAGRIGTSSNLDFKVYPEATNVNIEEVPFESALSSLSFSDSNSLANTNLEIQRVKVTNNSGIPIKFMPTSSTVDSTSYFKKEYFTAQTFTTWQQETSLTLSEPLVLAGIYGSSGDNTGAIAQRMCVSINDQPSEISEIQYAYNNIWKTQASTGVVQTKDFYNLNDVPSDYIGSDTVISKRTFDNDYVERFFATFCLDGDCDTAPSVNHALLVDNAGYTEGDVKAAFVGFNTSLGSKVSLVDTGSTSESVIEQVSLPRMNTCGIFDATCSSNYVWWDFIAPEINNRCDHVAQSPFAEIFGRTSCSMIQADPNNQFYTYSHITSYTQSKKSWAVNNSKMAFTMGLRGTAWHSKAKVDEMAYQRVVLKDGTTRLITSKYGKGFASSSFHVPAYTDKFGFQYGEVDTSMSIDIESNIDGVVTNQDCQDATDGGEDRHYKKGTRWVRQPPLDVPNVKTTNRFSSQSANTTSLIARDINGQELDKLNGYYIIPDGTVAYVSMYIVVPDLGPIKSVACEDKDDSTWCDTKVIFDINRGFTSTYMPASIDGKESEYFSTSIFLNPPNEVITLLE